MKREERRRRRQEEADEDDYIESDGEISDEGLRVSDQMDAIQDLL